MLNIMKMNAVGSEGKTPIMNFEFTFDNSTELPKGPGYQLGQRIYVIEEGSTAINNSTNIIYKYSSGKWVKTTNKSTSTTNTITENGSYNIASNIATGVGNIDVNVIGGGVTLIEKTITENGTYLPAQDEATAYSKVVVDVDDSAHFSIISLSVPSISGNSSNPTVSLKLWYLYTSNDGEYNVQTDSQIQQAVLCNPAKKIEIGRMLTDTYVAFTPDNNFDGFYINDSKIEPTGDTIGSKDDSATYIGVTTGSGGYTTGIKIFKNTSYQFPYTFSIR